MNTLYKKNICVLYKGLLLLYVYTWDDDALQFMCLLWVCFFEKQMIRNKHDFVHTNWRVLWLAYNGE